MVMLESSESGDSGKQKQRNIKWVLFCFNDSSLSNVGVVQLQLKKTGTVP